MAYIKLKTKDGTIILEPKEIRAAGKQIGAQLSSLTFTEMVETAKALKDMMDATGISKMLNLFARR